LKQDAIYNILVILSQAIVVALLYGKNCIQQIYSFQHILARITAASTLDFDRLPSGNTLLLLTNQTSQALLQ